MAQITRYHARKCLFGVRTMINHILGVTFPKTVKTGREYARQSVLAARQ